MKNVFGVNFGFPFYDFDYVEISCPNQKTINELPRVLAGTYLNQMRHVVVVKVFEN